MRGCERNWKMSETSTDQTHSEKWNKIKRNWANARLAHEGMMLEKIRRQNRIAELDARNAMTGETENTEGWPQTDGKGDDMGVSIGNENHYHYPEPPTLAPSPPESRPSPEPEPQPTPALKKPLSKLAKVGIIAALSTGSAGVGMAIPLIADALNPETPAVAPDANTWIEYDIEKWVPTET